MKNGFIKVAAITPKIKVCDTDGNADAIIEHIESAAKKGVTIACFPELCITGYTCGDLFLQRKLLTGAVDALEKIIEATKGKNMLISVGLPLIKEGKLFNCAAVMFDGTLLGLVPKRFIPNYGEFYEQRHFTPAADENSFIELFGGQIPFGTRLMFCCENIPELKVGVEICEDLWVPAPPSARHAVAGAMIILNGSASDEVVGKEAYRRELVKSHSSRLLCAYIYTDAGDGESTTDLVFSAHNIIAENGHILAEAEPFGSGLAITEVDVFRLISERTRMNTFLSEDGYFNIGFKLQIKETKLTRSFPKNPFVPSDEADRRERVSIILDMQSAGLKKRIEHTNAKTVVVGVSGGLDSTLALLVAVRAMKLLSRPASDVVAVTMPCFGTTERTKSNAVKLSESLGVTLREIDITKSVYQHFEDIGHDVENKNVVYENSQARERTQVLMDISNQTGGFVVGTGDLSELALGWATYNGDHMSMYGVNASVPKTLIRYIVKYVADTSNKAIAAVLNDVLETPVSPELLPAKDGKISQCTEDIVGPYELHDFFLYYFMRFGFEPGKIFRIAVYVFDGDYDAAVIKKWLATFIRRFFAQQFKRSCLPDCPKVGTVTLSPRGDFRMPSDAVSALWLQDI